MGQAKKKQEEANTPLLKELANGNDRVLFATNSAYVKTFNEDLDTAIKEQSSYNEVIVVDYKDGSKMKVQSFVNTILNGLVMHTKIAELEDNKVLEKLMRLLPLKGVAIFEANSEFVNSYDLVKEGTPLVNNIKSGYAPSIFYKSAILNSDKENPKLISKDIAIALQILDVHSDEMFREFGIEIGKMLKATLASKGINLVSIEYSIGIDSQNNMRLVDIDIEAKKDDKTLSVFELADLI